MKYILFLLFPAALSAQINISYSIDTIGGKDSFFLEETISRPLQGSTRPQTTTTSLLFRDTAELGAYIVRLNEERATLSTRVTQLQTQLSLLTSRITTITELRDSVMPIIAQRRRMVGGGSARTLRTETNAEYRARSEQLARGWHHNGDPILEHDGDGQVRTEKKPAKKPAKKDERPPRPAATKTRKE